MHLPERFQVRLLLLAVRRSALADLGFQGFKICLARAVILKWTIPGSLAPQKMIERQTCDSRMT